MFESIMIGLGLLLLIGGIIAARSASRRLKGKLSTYEEDGARAARLIARGVAGLGLLLVLLFTFFSTTYFQGVGEAKVIVNADGTIAGEDLDPGMGTKAPWQSTVDFDLFSQEILYAGNQEGQPQYTGGTVNGAEITTTVKGENGGSTQANVDISVTYTIAPEAVTDIYAKYRNQERFTKQVVEKTVLTTIRQVPSQFTAIEFRGDGRGEAAEQMLQTLNEKLNPLGVDVEFVNLQDIRYTEQVENALKEVEVANQNVLKQEAELRATEISAQKQVVQAQAEADANRLLSESLTPQVLQQRYLDALKEGTVFVVPEGSDPLVQVR